MGYAKGKNDIAGIIKVAMFGSLYEILVEDMEDEEKTRRKKEEKKKVSEPFLSFGKPINCGLYVDLWHIQMTIARKLIKNCE